ncbi:MAG: MaoC family dehydratase [Deltaproteobacteria bacterium]|nr:MaoC family dehydratase [Deltaproteobacteria bacterium]
MLERPPEASKTDAHLTRGDNYFEDFVVGDTLVHPRGRTLSEAEHMMLTNMVLNTAQLHFNQAMCEESPDAYFAGRRVVYGGLVLAFVAGLASEETTENALAELSMDNGRHLSPVFAGDTLFAESTVLQKRDSDLPDAGVVRFRLIGKNQRGETVLEIDREVLIKRRQRSAHPDAGGGEQEQEDQRGE